MRQGREDQNKGSVSALFTFMGNQGSISVRTLEDDVAYTGVSCEGVRKLGRLSTMPISQWWKVLPGAINSQALPL